MWSYQRSALPRRTRLLPRGRIGNWVHIGARFGSEIEQTAQPRKAKQHTSMAPLTRSRAKLDFCAASPASVKDAAPSAPVETAFAGLRRGLAIDAAYAGHFIKSMFPASLPALVFAIVAVCTYRDYGLNWDEGLQADLGLCSWSYYLSFGANTDALSSSTLR